MRLLLPSVIAAVYCFLSLALPLKAHFVLKALMGAAFLAAGLKYVFYQVVGGGFFRPNLPVPVMLTAEALYAALLVLFFLALVKDASSLALRLARLMGAPWRLPFTPGFRSALLVAAALACGAWGTWQAVRVPNVRTVEIALQKLPAELDGFTLVQLSDLHIGPVQKAAWLEEVVRKVNALSPDAVAVTGDMIDGLPRTLRDDMKPLAKLRAKYGVFGVTGNHEYYYDAKDWLKELSSLGVTMLRTNTACFPAISSSEVCPTIPPPASGAGVRTRRPPLPGPRQGRAYFWPISPTTRACPLPPRIFNFPAIHTAASSSSLPRSSAITMGATSEGFTVPRRANFSM